MAKNSITDYDNTSGNNTDVQSVDISEGCSPSGINNAIREVMADLADVNDGTVALTSPQAANMTVTGTVTTDTIAENTSAAGVTIDGVLLKDGGVGSATAAITAYLSSINGGQIGGNRNLIINGAMQVAQRGDSTGITTSGYYACDRYNFTLSSLGTWSVSQSSTAPTGFANSLKLEATTADASPAASDFALLAHKFEGQNLQHLKKGTSSAESITLSFWVRSSKTGTYIVEIRDNDNTRIICSSYTINSADTFEYKTLTFAGDTVGSLDDDNALSFQCIWWLASGTDFTSGTLATSWASSTNANRAVGQVNLADTANATWYITGVQLEVGEQATPFEHRSFGDELARCKRYYQKSFPYGTAPFNNAGQGGARWDERTAVMPPNSYSTSIYIGAWCHLSVPMRSTPTTTQYNTNTSGTSGSYLNDLQNSSTSTSYSILSTNHNTEKLHFYVGGIHSQGNAFGVNWEADAEL